MQKILLRILQLLLLAVILGPFIVLVYKIIPKTDHDHEIVMDPDQDEYEFQQDQKHNH